MKDGLIKYLGISIDRLEKDLVQGNLKLNKNHLQPYGLMHGGISCVLAETLASIAGNLNINQEQFIAVGQEINTSHLKIAKEETIYGSALPLRIGKKTQVWEVKITNKDEELISVSRVSLSILNKK